MKRYCLPFLLLIFSLLIRGQTIVPGGYVSGTWESSQSPFLIQGNIEIHFDSTLTIEPGVNVFFGGPFKLIIHGLLNASGTETDSILFTCVDSVNGWQGIEFYQANDSLGTSIIKYCILTHGYKPSGNGGAIYVNQSDNVLIQNCLIDNNYSESGGGICINDSWIEIAHCKISHNRAKEGGGGINCSNSSPYLYDLQIINNVSGGVGGIYFGDNDYYQLTLFEDLLISNNVGSQMGGMLLSYAGSLILDNCNISKNRGHWVGGIAVIGHSLEYWGYPVEQNQVYMNKGGWAYDLYYLGDEGTIIDIDTFTMINPDEYLVYPLDKFNFLDGIEFGKMEQTDSDLYISESGSDTNDGLTQESPLRSFEFALRKITSDVENENTLWVMPGYYSLSVSDSASPVYIKNNVNIAATLPGEAIIDGDSISRVFYSYNRHDFTLSGLEIRNGYANVESGGTFMNEVSGGGMYLNYSDGNIDSCSFISNYSHFFGGGAILDRNYNVNFNNCKFIQNTSRLLGGGLMNFQPATSSRLNLNNCEFQENHSEHGGGSAFTGDKIKLVNCKYQGNISDNGAGGCSFNDEMPDLVNCQFSHNNAGGNGGGCYITGGSNSKMINCTFSDNGATEGTAIYMVFTANQNLINTIFWNSTIPYADMIHIKAGASCLVNYSDIQGGEGAFILDGTGSHYHWQEGNTTDYPAFIDTTAGDYSLNWNSPCIEAGKEDTTGLQLPLTDLNGDPRIVNARVDMGAYEYQFPVYIDQEPPYIAQINVYPLVANTIIDIEFPLELRENKLSIKLYSSSGLEVKSISKSEGNSITQMEISELSAGLYILKIMDSNSIISTSKVIIAR